MSEIRLSTAQLDTFSVFLQNAAQDMFIGIFTLFIAVIVWQMLTGKINLKGLLIDKSNGKFSPGRLQNLVLTFLVAALYLGKLLENSVTNMLPDLPDWCLETIAGSSALYLGGKSSLLLGRLISSFFNSKMP